MDRSSWISATDHQCPSSHARSMSAATVVVAQIFCLLLLQLRLTGSPSLRRLVFMAEGMNGRAGRHLFWLLKQMLRYVFSHILWSRACPVAMPEASGRSVQSYMENECVDNYKQQWKIPQPSFYRWRKMRSENGHSPSINSICLSWRSSPDEEGWRGIPEIHLKNRAWSQK